MGTANNPQAWDGNPNNNDGADSNIGAIANTSAPNVVDNWARGIMAGVWNYKADTDGYATAGGTADALTITSQQAISLSHLADGYRLGLWAASANTSNAVTIAIDGLSAKTIKAADGGVVPIGGIQAGMLLDLAYEAGAGVFRALNVPGKTTPGVLPKGHLWGLGLSNNGSDATNDIDIAAGKCRDGSDAYDMVLASALTKRLDASWSVGTGNGGLDTGSIANTTYHIWLIARSDTGVVDALFSASASSPTMPTNYDYKRRIGSILRESAAIVTFTQRGDIFWRDIVTDYSATTARSRAALTLSLPTGLQIEAILTAYLSSATAGSKLMTVYPAGAGRVNMRANGASDRNSISLRCFTNTSAQVELEVVIGSGTLDAGEINTHGWVDTRGRAL